MNPSLPNSKSYAIVLFASLALVSTFVMPAPAKGMYNPKHGRWLQRDPLGVRPDAPNSINLVQKQYTDGMNLYEYVRSRPSVLSDASGELLSSCDIEATIRTARCPDPNIKRYQHNYRPYHKGFIVAGSDIDYGPNKYWPISRLGTCTWPKNDMRGGITPGNTFYIQRLNTCPSCKRKLKYGPGKGKSCDCASCSEIHGCVKFLCNAWNGTPFSFISHNCWHFVKEGMEGCCLYKSSMYIR